MIRFLAVLAFAFQVFMFHAGTASAQSLSDVDRNAFQGIITDQLEAFRADDGTRAYSHAAPLIRKIFPTPENFMAMVKKGYPPVYRPQSYRFGEAGLNPAGVPTQRVTIVGPDGQTYEAIYSMERQPDGTWRINGCALLRAPGLDA